MYVYVHCMNVCTNVMCTEMREYMKHEFVVGRKNIMFDDSHQRPDLAGETNIIDSGCRLFSLRAGKR